MTPVALAAALSAGAGVSLGLLGGGGSILIVPILLYAAHLGPKPAITLSLLIVGTASAAAAIPHARAGNVRFRAAMAFGVASMGGAAVGGRLSHYVPSSVLLAVFTLMMFVTGVAMLRRSRTGVASAQSKATLRMVGYGMAVGVVTGLVGAGGGFVIVPALVLLGGLPMAAAIGTSLVIIAMNSLTAFVAHLDSTPLDLRLAGSLAVSAVVGSLVGAWVARRIKPERLRTLFALLVLAVAGVMAVQQLWS